MEVDIKVGDKVYTLQGTEEEMQCGLDSAIRSNKEFWAVARAAVGNYQAELLRWEVRNGKGRRMPIIVPQNSKKS